MAVAAVTVAPLTVQRDTTTGPSASTSAAAPASAEAAVKGTTTVWPAGTVTSSRPDATRRWPASRTFTVAVTSSRLALAIPISSVVPAAGGPPDTIHRRLGAGPGTRIS